MGLLKDWASNTAGALRPEWQRLVRPGIGAKLQLAFGVVAGLTILASAVGLLSFSAIEGGLRRESRCLAAPRHSAGHVGRHTLAVEGLESPLYEDVTAAGKGGAHGDTARAAVGLGNRRVSLCAKASR